MNELTRASIGAVSVGWVDLTVPGRAGATFDSRDLVRAGERPANRRAAFRVGRDLLRRMLAEAFGDAPLDLVSDACPDCGKAHGALRVVGATAVASLAYTDGLVAAAISPTASSVGVDAERDALSPEGANDLSRLLGVAPESVLRHWTMVEATLKADGRGLRLEPQHVRIEDGRGYPPGDALGFDLAEVSGPPGYLISVAWR